MSLMENSVAPWLSRLSQAYRLESLGQWLANHGVKGASTLQSLGLKIWGISRKSELAAPNRRGLRKCKSGALGIMSDATAVYLKKPSVDEDERIVMALSVYPSIYLSFYLPIHVCVYVYMYTWVYIYACGYIYIYIYICTYSKYFEKCTDVRVYTKRR